MRQTAPIGVGPEAWLDQPGLLRSTSRVKKYLVGQAWLREDCGRDTS
jgi:hypothetical protein